MKTKMFFLLIALYLCFSFCSNAQTKVKVKDYIEQVKTSSQQGAAVYGRYLFQFSAGAVCDIYDLKKRCHLGQMLFEGSEVKHCDTVCFGDYKIEKKDKFPVLYVSGSQIYNEEERGLIWAYRIIHIKETWHLELVQTIITPKIKEIGAFPDMLISKEEGCMWLIGWNLSMSARKKDGSGAHLTFTKFKTPNIKEGELDENGIRKVFLNYNEALTSFTINNCHDIQQGVCLNNQKIYVPYGASSSGYQGIDIISLNEGKVINNINLMGTTVFEPEAVFFYKDEIYIADQARTIKKIIDYRDNE